jgi:two-component system, chemotaxis family, protein-glutamate methylesterase/glutaminase
VPPARIVVIGASAGGVEALSRLFRDLPADFPGSFFVVLHTVASSESQLPRIISRSGPLRAVHPEDGTEIREGMVYVARPNHHLMIEDARVRSLVGPRVNGYRPSINVLFESAARAYGNRVTGVILSGSLDDGTLGLQAIKGAGGKAVVQDPVEAVFTGMPRSAIENVEVDFQSSVSDIPQILVEMARTELDVKEIPAMSDSGVNRRDSRVADSVANSVESVAGFTCPECGGVLQEEQSGHMVRFHCHVGHQLSERALLHAQGDTLEAALWTALRVLEERIHLAERVEKRAIDNGNELLARRFHDQNADALQKAQIIRRVLLGGDGHQPVTKLQDEIAYDDVTQSESEEKTI